MERSWIKVAPSSGSLIAQRKDERKGRANGTAIIIPSFRDSEMLDAHLSMLSKQTASGFDIIIIYGDEDGFNPNALRQSILHIRPHDNIGCAGSFYLGERICLEEGYEKIILADDDCLPESLDLIERLQSGLRGKSVSLPLIRALPGRMLAKGVIHHYGGITKEALESTGLTYAPFFIGGEEFDLMRRIAKKGIRVVDAQAIATHPRWKPIFLWDIRKLHMYSRGNIIQTLMAKDILRSWISFAIHMHTCVSMAFLGKYGQARAYLLSAWEASGCRFDEVRENHAPPVASEQASLHEGSSRITMNSGKGSVELESEAFLQVEGKGHLSQFLSKLSDIAQEAGSIRTTAGKDVLFDGWCNVKDLPIILIARSSSISYEGKNYRITQGRPFWLSALSLGGFIAAAPISMALGFILAARGISTVMLEGIESEGYGLQSK
jgi:GT2 family glycosyltransferase